MKTTHFITVQDGTITGRHCGDIGADFHGTPFHAHERIEVPADAAVSALDRVEYYTPGWKRRTDAELVREGIMPLPAGCVLDGGELRRMSLVEMIESGQAEMPEGCLIEDGELRPMTDAEKVDAGLVLGYKVVGGELVPMTLLEQVEAGQITEAEHLRRACEESEAEMQRRIAALQTPEALARAEVDDGYARKRKAALVALLSVKDQKGWPQNVKWPEEA